MHVVTLLAALVWVAAGLLLLSRRPTQHRTAVLVGLTLVANGVDQPAFAATQGTTTAVVGRLLVATGLTLSAWTLSVFPDGAFRPSWLRWLVVAFGAWGLASAAVAPAGAWADVVGGMATFVGLLVPTACQVRRLRRETDRTRRAQTAWVVYGATVALLLELAVSLPYFVPGLVVPGSTYDNFQDVTSTLALSLVPVCFVVAMLGRHLYDVEVVVSRTIVYATLTLLVVVAYLGTLGLAGLLVGHSDSPLVPLVAAGVAVLVVGPLRGRLQVRARNLVYGLRAEPYLALRALDRRLAASLPGDDVAAELVAGIHRALRQPYVAVVVGPDPQAPVASALGSPTDDEVVLPVHYGGEVVGRIVVGHDGRRPLDPGDLELLEDLAAHAGGALQGLLLATSLQSARERLVLTREEERRRLRSDLHDGLAPALAASGLNAATAAELLARDPERAAAILGRLQTQLQSAVGDIRTLVDGLRPATLDELGLVRSLEQRAEEVRRVVDVELVAPELPTLPAAVEVAAYQISQEALMNVVRHARAQCVSLTLALRDHGLELVVADDGLGIASSASAGVGLGSMRARAAELGGRCRVTARPSGGTEVRVWLPIREDAR